MSLTDVIETSLALALTVFVLLCLISLLPRFLKWRRGKSWSDMVPNPARFIAVRLAIAVSLGVAMLLLITAALTLNQHRPPADNTPVVKVRGPAGPITVDLELDDCGQSVAGTLRVRGAGPARRFARIYSDGDGAQRVRLSRRGFGRFSLEDPITKRGLLSCYLQLPKVVGGTGSAVRLTLGEGMEVDTVNSVPAPTGFSGGRWVWSCPPGEGCPALATMGLALEEGTKQVIVLVLAAVLGAIIALTIGEFLVEPLRRRLDRRRPAD